MQRINYTQAVKYSMLIRLDRTEYGVPITEKPALLKPVLARKVATAYDA